MLPLPLAPITLPGIQSLIDKLPAHARASVRWTPRAVAAQVDRLRFAPTITRELLVDAGNATLEVWSAFSAVLELLDKVNLQDLLDQIRADVAQQVGALQALPPAAIAPATRALATLTAVGAMGVVVLPALKGKGFDLDSAYEEMPQEERAELSSLVCLHLLVAALVEAAKWEPHELTRVKQLARFADETAFKWATLVTNFKPDDPNLRLPWYFRPAQGEEQYLSYATWALSAPPIEPPIVGEPHEASSDAPATSVAHLGRKRISSLPAAAVEAHRGDFVAVEVDSGNVHFARSDVDAIREARRLWPLGRIYLGRIGGSSAYVIGAR